MRYGRTFLALMMISGLGFSADVWKYHFGQKPVGSEGVDPTTLPVVVDQSKTRLNLGTVLPKALEFEGVLLNRGAEAQRVQLFEGDLVGVGRVKVGLPEDTTIPAGGSLKFKVIFDGHGMDPGSVKIPLTFMVGESVLPVEFEATISDAKRAWVLPHRILLTPGDGTPGSAKLTTHFNVHSFDGLSFDQVALEDGQTPIRVLGSLAITDGIQGDLALDPRGISDDGKPTAKSGEVRLLVYRDGVRMDAISIQWNLQ